MTATEMIEREAEFKAELITQCNKPIEHLAKVFEVEVVLPLSMFLDIMDPSVPLPSPSPRHDSASAAHGSPETPALSQDKS